MCLFDQLFNLRNGIGILNVGFALCFTFKWPYINHHVFTEKLELITSLWQACKLVQACLISLLQFKFPDNPVSKYTSLQAFHGKFVVSLVCAACLLILGRKLAMFQVCYKLA